MHEHFTSHVPNDAVESHEPTDVWHTLRIPGVRHDPWADARLRAMYPYAFVPLSKLVPLIMSGVESRRMLIAVTSWTVLWVGYNILARDVPSLNWMTFDLIYALFAYFGIIQVIWAAFTPGMVARQNKQAQERALRAEQDRQINRQAQFEVNQKMQADIKALQQHLDQNTELLMQLMRHLECHTANEPAGATASDGTASDARTSVEAAN